MMIGPTGSGKSTYVAKYYDPAIVISSDDLRRQLCGDFRSQERNNDAFSALHSIVKARIAAGLHTVVDTTNLKKGHRQELRDCAPQNGTIEYIVLNRPMREKWESADWRYNVYVKGKPLLEYHETVFLSNLSSILKGDDDPRVTVKDLRK